VEARYSTPVQIGPEAQPASCRMGTGGWGEEWLGHDADPSLPSNVMVKKE